MTAAYLNSLAWMFFLSGLVILFPDECLRFSAWIVLRVYLFFANLRLRWATWVLYQKVKKDFERNGMKIPPYHFISLQDRDIW